MSDSHPSRRRFLSGVLAAGVTASAGCLGLRSGTANSNRALRLTLHRRSHSLRESFVVDLSETELERDEAAFTATLNGSSYTTQYQKPFVSNPEDPVYTRHDGTYYRLGSVVVDEVTTTHPVLRLREASSEKSKAVAASSLPKRDQVAVRIAYFAARARGDEGGVPWGLVQRGGYVYRDNDAASESELLADSGPRYVSYRDQVYSVEISREQFHEPVYRATVDPVASSPEQMERILRAKFVDARFSREDLSSAARGILRDAENGYEETHPYSTGYQELLRALHKRAYLDGDIQSDAGVSTDGRHVLRYDGVYYDYRLFFESDRGE